MWPVSTFQTFSIASPLKMTESNMFLVKTWLASIFKKNDFTTKILNTLSVLFIFVMVYEWYSFEICLSDIYFCFF